MDLRTKRKIKVKTKKIANSFKYAFEGFMVSFEHERNLKFHIIMMLLVILAGVLLGISQMEWYICTILFGVMIGAELFNTAIEKTIDIAMPHKDPRAKIAKDISAAAVLMIAISAAIVGIAIFLPKIMLIIK